MVDTSNTLVETYNKGIDWLADESQLRKMEEMKDDMKVKERQDINQFIVIELICAILCKMGEEEAKKRENPVSSYRPQTFSAVFKADVLKTSHKVKMDEEIKGS